MFSIRKKLLPMVLLGAMALTACGQAPAPADSAPSPTGSPALPAPVEATEIPSPIPALLGVEDLRKALDALDPAEGTLTWFDDTGERDSYPAGKAICGENYADRLRNFTWEEYRPYPMEESGWRIRYTAPGVTLTACQGGGSIPFHLVTDRGEGWFTLPYIADSPGTLDGQTGWMIYDEVFVPWYGEAKAALRYGGAGNGEPLTAEELEWFRDYTASVTQTYDYEWGGWIGGATPISCFFTSRYDDPRDMDAGEFMYYFPGPEEMEPVDEAEFRLVQKQLNWLGEDGQPLTLAEMPVPCHRDPRSYVNEILTQYAGITVEEMHTDWLTELIYVPETDCFYGFASDFGPGMFHARYGEREGDTVTLWEQADGYTGGDDVLRLRKVGEQWRVLSHQQAE